MHPTTMNIQWKIVLLCLLFLGFSTPPERKLRIFLAGDSTMQTYKEEETPMRGWGQYFSGCFNENVQVVNKAIGGRSSRSFIEQNRWQEIVDQLQAGDWVFIQFGHNDGSSKPERYTSPEDYRKNLIRFIKDVQTKKANPVLLTSISMRVFDEEGKVRNGLGAYPQIAREVAQSQRVPLIDLNVKTTDYINSIGDEASKKAYMWLSPGEHTKYPEGLQDNTHLRETGARKVAEMAAEGIKELKLKPLVKHLKGC